MSMTMLWFILWLVALAGSFGEAHRSRKFQRAATYWRKMAMRGSPPWTPLPPLYSKAKRR